MSKKVRRISVKDVENYLRTHVNGSVSQIRNSLRTSNNMVEDALKELMAEGVVTQYEENGERRFALSAIRQAAEELDSKWTSQKIMDELRRYSDRYMREHGVTPQILEAMTDDELRQLKEDINDSYMQLVHPLEYAKYGRPSELKGIDPEHIDMMMDILERAEALEKKVSQSRPEPSGSRRYLSDDEKQYRQDVCIDYVRENPGATSKEIANNHKVDPRYGRIDSDTVHKIMKNLESKGGSFVMHTKIEHGEFSWFLKDIPTDIAERIRKRLDFIRLHEIEVEPLNGIPLTESQVFVLNAGDRDVERVNVVKGPRAEYEHKMVERCQDMFPSVSEATEDSKETIYETDAESEEPEVEQTEDEIMSEDTEEYIFEINDRAVVRHVTHRCTLAEAKVAADVLSKATNSKIGVKVSKYVYEIGGKQRCSEDSANRRRKHP